MDDQAVDKQIANMVSFIIQEAKEKASEIQTLANEEFTIQKAKLLQTEKLKVQRDFERREKSILLQKKMYVDVLVSSKDAHVLGIFQTVYFCRFLAHRRWRKRRTVPLRASAWKSPACVGVCLSAPSLRR